MNKKTQSAPATPREYTGAMPHAEDGIEEAVLGSLLIEQATAQRYLPTLQEGYFYNPKNRLIFHACRSLYNKNNEGIDILTVVEQLRAEGTLEEAGNPYYVTELSGRIASSAHIEYHIAILAEYHMRRRMLEINMKFNDLVADQTQDILEQLGAELKELEEITRQMPGINEMREMPPVVNQVLEQLDARIASEEKELTGVATGFPPLDEYFLGWQKSTLNIIAGRTSEGKTAVLVHSLVTAAEKGLKICLVSMESDAEKLVERMILAKTGIDPDRFHKGNITPKERETIEDAGQMLGQLEIRTYDKGSIGMEKVCMMVKALHADHKCDLLGIDYLQLFRDPHHRGNREEEVAGNSRMLKQLSLQLSIPVIALCQFNREVVQNDKQLPQKENIRESGAVEQDADTITMIYHPQVAGLASDPVNKYPVTPDMMMLIVSKNRNGATGAGYVSHNPSFTQFAEYTPPAGYLIKLAEAESKKKKKKKGAWQESESFKKFNMLSEEDGNEEEDGELPF